MLSSKYLCPVIKKHEANFHTQIAHPSSPGLATSFPAQYIVNENPFTDHCTLISCKCGCVPLIVILMLQYIQRVTYLLYLIH